MICVKSDIRTNDSKHQNEHVNISEASLTTTKTTINKNKNNNNKNNNNNQCKNKDNRKTTLKGCDTIEINLVKNRNT